MKLCMIIGVVVLLIVPSSFGQETPSTIDEAASYFQAVKAVAEARKTFDVIIVQQHTDEFFGKLTPVSKTRIRIRADTGRGKYLYAYENYKFRVGGKGELRLGGSSISGQSGTLLVMPRIRESIHGETSLEVLSKSGIPDLRFVGIWPFPTSYAKGLAGRESLARIFGNDASISVSALADEAVKVTSRRGNDSFRFITSWTFDGRALMPVEFAKYELRNQRRIVRELHQVDWQEIAGQQFPKFITGESGIIRVKEDRSGAQRGKALVEVEFNWLQTSGTIPDGEFATTLIDSAEDILAFLSNE